MEKAQVRRTRTPIDAKRAKVASYWDSRTSWGTQYAFMPAKQYCSPSSVNLVPEALTKPAGTVLVAGAEEVVVVLVVEVAAVVELIGATVELTGATVVVDCAVSGLDVD